MLNAISRTAELKFGNDIRSLRRQNEGLNQTEKLLQSLNTGAKKVKAIDRYNFDDGKRELWITYIQQPSEAQLKAFKHAKPQERTLKIVEGGGKKKTSIGIINQAEVFEAFISLSELHRDYKDNFDSLNSELYHLSDEYKNKIQRYNTDHTTSIYIELSGAVNHTSTKLAEKEKEQKQYVEAFIKQEREEYEQRHPIKTAFTGIVNNLKTSFAGFKNSFSRERIKISLTSKINKLYKTYHNLTLRKYNWIENNSHPQISNANLLNNETGAILFMSSGHNPKRKLVRAWNADEIDAYQKYTLKEIKRLEKELSGMQTA